MVIIEKIQLSIICLISVACLHYSCQKTKAAHYIYYVSQEGDDGNPGSEERPFKTLNKINAINLEPGDQVLFKGGEVFDGTLWLDLDGRQSQPIIISSYGGGQATINGGAKEAVIISGKYFELRQINAKGLGRKTGNTTNGILLSKASDAKVEDIVTAGFQKSGLELLSGNRIQLTNIRANENGFCGILISGRLNDRSKNVIIKNCVATNNPGDPTVLDNHSGNGILVGMSDSVLIDHCAASGNGWDMPGPEMAR